MSARDTRWAFGIGALLGVGITAIAANHYDYIRFKHDCRALGGTPDENALWSPVCQTKYGPIYGAPFWFWRWPW